MLIGGYFQGCLLWRDRAKSRHNVTSPSQCHVTVTMSRHRHNVASCHHDGSWRCYYNGIISHCKCFLQPPGIEHVGCWRWFTWHVYRQHCLLWRDRAKLRRNVTSPSQRCVASLWRIVTLLQQWDKLVTVKKIYIHPATDTSDADDDLHDTYTEHVVFSFTSK
jgi:hypothetical protein